MDEPASSRTVVALRHLAFEDLGVFETVLLDRGYHVRYVDVAVDSIDLDEVDRADILVVLGGPIAAYDEDAYPFLRDTKAGVVRRLDSRRPMLGICLGAQLIAEAMGAAVRSMHIPEIGYGPLSLTPEGSVSVLRELDGVPVLHWHGDEFGIPPGASHLARSAGGPHQAFSAEAVLALQFHLETDHRRIEQWLVGHAHELKHHGIQPGAIREQARDYGPQLERIAANVLGAWLDETAGRMLAAAGRVVESR